MQKVGCESGQVPSTTMNKYIATFSTAITQSI